MKIILDERETELYTKCLEYLENMKIEHALKKEKDISIEISKRVLPLGDILIQDEHEHDLLLIERKTFSDLLASIRDGRYEEQSYRLMHSDIGLPLHNVVYLLEGMFSQMKEKDRKIIFASITSLQYFKGFSVMRTANIRESAEWLLETTVKIERDFKKGKTAYNSSINTTNTTTTTTTLPPSNTNGNENTNTNTTITTASYSSVVKKVKCENITPSNIGEILLCQIPSVHSTTAIAIMKKFGTFQHLMKELESCDSCLDDIQTETNGKKRKISKKIIQNLKLYLLHKGGKKEEEPEEPEPEPEPDKEPEQQSVPNSVE